MKVSLFAMIRRNLTIIIKYYYFSLYSVDEVNMTGLKSLFGRVSISDSQTE